MRLSSIEVIYVLIKKLIPDQGESIPVWLRPIRFYAYGQLVVLKLGDCVSNDDVLELGISCKFYMHRKRSLR